MPDILRISVGQHSEAGRKPLNQDFHGVCVPHGALLAGKGIAVALADGISTSAVSQDASQTAVGSFLEDYYCTPESWSVKTAAERVLAATNAWLHAQTRQSEYRYDKDRGYVCTLSALILKARTAHLFHVGDGRIARLQGGTLETLTEAHRVRVTREQSYLSRALGFNPQLDIDYLALPVEVGDVFVLTTDGVHGFLDDRAMAVRIAEHASDLDAAARAIVADALAHGSDDNLTIQIVRVDGLPVQEAGELARAAAALPLPPALAPRMRFDGYTIVRELHDSHRSHLYLATDDDSGATVVIKTPSVDLRDDADYLERLLLEDWIARRIDHAHVLRAHVSARPRAYLYVATEYVEGQTLAQWMIDHPRPGLETVRLIVEQIARGLRAFHRLEMIHQDLRPENVLIDATGTAKIIDFGAVRVAGVADAHALDADEPMLGTLQYAAPEYFLGEAGTPAADVFSLGVIAYQMLTGRLPYGAAVSRVRTRADLRRLRYQPAADGRRPIPAWVDAVLRRAVHPDPLRRYGEPAEFVHDLRHPHPDFAVQARMPLIERHPLRFWQGLSLLLAVLVLILLAELARH